MRRLYTLSRLPGFGAACSGSRTEGSRPALLPNSNARLVADWRRRAEKLRPALRRLCRALAMTRHRKPEAAYHTV